MLDTIRETISQLKEAMCEDGALVDSMAQLQLEHGLPAGPFSSLQILAMNAAPELLDKKLPAKFPVILLYCDRLRPGATPRFCKFAGTVRIGIEVRVSSDRIETLEQELECYTNAVLAFLLERRGSWNNSTFFGGEYEVQFSQAKPGGKHFIQSSKILLDLALAIH